MLDYLRGGARRRRSAHLGCEVEDAMDGRHGPPGGAPDGRPRVLIAEGMIGLCTPLSRLFFLAEPAGNAALWGLRAWSA